MSSELAKPGSSGFESLKRYLVDRKPTIESMIPSGTVTVDKLLGSALLAAKKTDALLRCEPQSVFLALMDAAALGLTVHWGPRGEAALIPYKTKCQLIIGYRGYMSMMVRSGLVRNIAADVVKVGDEFSFKRTQDGELFSHEPNYEDGDRDGKGDRLYYAIAYLPAGGSQIAILSREKAMKIRDMVLGKMQDWQRKDAPWTLWETEMGIKSAVRQLGKVVPMTELLERAAEVEERNEREMGEAVRVQVPATQVPPSPQVLVDDAPPPPAEPSQDAKPDSAPPEVVEADPLEREVAALRDGVQRASTIKELQALAQRISALPPKEKGELNLVYTQRANAIRGHR